MTNYFAPTNLRSTCYMLTAFICLLFHDALLAQRIDATIGKVITPMPFPKPNLNPDSTVNNQHAIAFDLALNFEIYDTAWTRNADFNSIPGDPGILGLGKPIQLPSNRAFSALSLESSPDTYPASANIMMHMHFPDWAQNSYSQCSGALIDPKHVLTAGHCVHDLADGGWADLVDVYPAYDDVINSFFGSAQAVNLYSWTGWTQNEMYEHDMAIIELDRPVGALAGWLGYGTSFHNANPYHNYSYPGDPPYNGELMYVRQGTFDNANTWILYHPDYSYGGQSGSSSADDDYYTYSCLSHGTDEPNAYTGHTRIAGSRFSQIQEFIAQNTPTTPDLVAMRVTAIPTFLASGAQLDYFDFVLHNYSSASFTGTLNVDYYLSEDDYITGSDEFLGSASYSISALEAKGTQWVVNNITFSIPDGMTPGEYYLGVQITNDDVNSLNNYSDYQDALPITIFCAQPEPPVLSHTGQYELCNWDEIELYAFTSCSDCEIYWSTGEIGNFIYVSEPGTYTAEAYNSCGNISWSSEPLIVEVIYVPDPPEIDISGPATPCEGESITLTATNICQGCDVYWSTNEWGESITVYDEDTYFAYLSNFCGDSPGTSVTVNFEEEPNAVSITTNGPTSLCTGQSVTLTAQNVCSGCDVLWSNGQSGSSITVSSAGTFTASVSNDCGTSPLSNSIAVTAGTAPSSPSVTANSSTVLCPAQSVTLAASNVCAGCTVTWSNGFTGPSIVVSSPGTFTATVTNPCGVSGASNSIIITSALLPEAATISANGSTIICGSGSVMISASNVCAGCTITWSNGQTGSTITVDAAGQYTAIVNNACGASIQSNVVSVMVHSSFIPAIEVNDTCRLAAPSGSQYQWSVDDVNIAGATKRFWTAEVTGYYGVSMVNDAGCPGESDAVFARACTITSIEELGNVTLRLYPNPASDQIRLEIQSSESLHNVQLTLFALDGRFISTLWKSSTLVGYSTQNISLLDFPSGFYLYHLTCEEGVKKGRLVVVE